MFIGVALFLALHSLNASVGHVAIATTSRVTLDFACKRPGNSCAGYSCRKNERRKDASAVYNTALGARRVCVETHLW